MAPSKPERARNNDVVIAKTAIHYASGYSSVDKQIAALLLEHYNKKTGQCDPSNGRIAKMLSIDERTVRRGTAELCGEGRLFCKSSHGGKSGRASYTPQWSVFRAIMTDLECCMKTGDALTVGAQNRAKWSGGTGGSNRAKQPGSTVPNTRAKSPGSNEREQGEMVRKIGRNGPVEQGETALQTLRRNPSIEPLITTVALEYDAARPFSPSSSERNLQELLRREVVARKPPGYEASERAATSGCSRSDAAWASAQRRLDAAIASADGAWQSAMWVLTDIADRDQAITAELKRRGEGIACLQAAVRLARLRSGGAGRAH